MSGREERTPMQRGAWLFSLRAGKEQAYREAHSRVWPELIEAARSAGLKNHSVFLRGSMVFGYAEAEDLNATMERLDALDVTRRWNEAMADLMEDVDGVVVDEVFHFD
jgi:L-rhamnose mutarotase